VFGTTVNLSCIIHLLVGLDFEVSVVFPSWLRCWIHKLVRAMMRVQVAVAGACRIRFQPGPGITITIPLLEKDIELFILTTPLFI